MTITSRSGALGLLTVSLVLAGCGTSTDSTSDADAGPVTTVAASAVPDESAPADAPAEGAGAIGGPCDLLTAEQLSAAVGVDMGDGEETIDEARQVQTCTWATDDMTTIVVAGLTDVAAEEAYQTNYDLAPAYFDGDPVETTVPGADRAYAVQQPDVGWAVGAIASDRFLQVQVGGSDITQAIAESLAADAVAHLAGS